MPKRTKGSIYDVAREAGVSIGTVSRVFNNRTNVADDTRELVLKAARRVNYLPRIRRRPVTIGLVLQEMSALTKAVGFTGEIIATIAGHMAQRECALEIIPLDDMEAVYRKYLSGLMAVIFDKGGEALQEIDHVPVLLINNRIDRPNFYSVSSDHAEGARMGTRYLLERGHTRVGFLEISPENWGAQERERGYREAMRELEVEVQPGLVAYTRTRPVRKGLEALLEQNATGVVICGEDLSMSATQVLLHEMKVRIPEELSIVTYEIPSVSSVLTPPQTTIAQPWEDLGAVAVDVILSLAHGSTARDLNILLHNRLIERESVRPLR